MGLIDRIFDTYHNLALEKSHKNLYLFTFNIDDFILSNKKYPDYLSIEEDLSITDSKNDYLIKSECYYMTDTSEVRGEIYLKKNTIEFIQKLEYTLTDTATKKLKKMDQDLFQAEIKKFENQEKISKYFGSIDYRDIIDIKYLCLTSMHETTDDCPAHDFHL